MSDVLGIKELIDKTLDDSLDPGEVLSTQLYEQYPKVPPSTLRGVLDRLVRSGKMSKRKLSSGKFAYKVIP